MAYDTKTPRTDKIEWVAHRVRDVFVLAAGIALALPLILPFG